MGISDDRYLSIHLARVEEMTILPSDGARPPAGEPLSWLLGADEGLHESEFASQRSTVFAAVGTHHTEESARTCAAAGVAEFADASETWSAALRPTRSHGSCNWVDGGHFDTGHERTAGPIAVMTSVGWDVGPGFQLERAVDFGEAVTRVRAAMWSEPVDGMTSHQAFVFPGCSSMTASRSPPGGTTPLPSRSPTGPARTRPKWTASVSTRRPTGRRSQGCDRSRHTAPGTEQIRSQSTDLASLLPDDVSGGLRSAILGAPGIGPYRALDNHVAEPAARRGDGSSDRQMAAARSGLPSSATSSDRRG